MHGVRWIALLVAAIPIMARAGTDYPKLIQEKLGADRPGMIIDSTADGQWELISVGSSVIDTEGGKSAIYARQEALIIAQADAKRALGEYVDGVRVQSSSTVNTKLAADDTGKAEFSQFMSSHRSTSSEAFLRGTHEVARWDGADGKSVFVAFAIRAADIDNASTIADAIAAMPDRDHHVVIVKAPAKGADADANFTEVRALGFAPINRDDTSKCRRAALFDALQQAVEQVVGTRVAGWTSVRNLVNVRQDIETATAGSVRSFTILEEGSKDNEWHVLVEAQIQPTFSSCLELINLLLKNPPVCVAGRATNGMLREGAVPLQRDARARLQHAGIHLTEYRGPIPTLADGLSRATADHASILIWCNAGDEFSAQAYCVATQQPIGPKVTQRWVDDPQLGRRFALSDDDAARLIDGICAHWNDLIFNGSSFRVVISNITDLWRQTRAFRQVIQDMQGYRSIEQLSGDAGHQQAVFSIRATGTVDAFLDSLFEAIDASPNQQLKSLKLQKQEGNCVYLAFP